MKGRKGGFLYLLTIAYRNIYRNKRRSILCIIAISIAVFFTIFMVSFMHGMIGSVKTISAIFESGHIMIYSAEYEDKKDFLPLQYPINTGDQGNNEFMEKLESIEGVTRAFARIRSFVTLTNNEVKHGLLLGIDLAREMQYNDFNQTNKSDGLIEGRYPEPDKNECAIGSRFAKKIGVKVGDRLDFKVISSQFSDKFASPLITGIFDFDYLSIDNKCILMDIERVRKLTVLKDKAQTIHLFTESEADIPVIEERVKDHVAGMNIIVKDWLEGNWYLDYIMSVGLLVYNIIFAVFIVVASFLIVNTIIMVIHERMKEIGMMGALGLSRKEIIIVFFLEAVCLSFLGSILGAIFGGVLTGVLSQTPISYEAMAGGVEMPVSNTVFVKFSLKYILFGLWYGLAISSLCTIIPSLKAAFIEPVEALRR